MYRLLLTSALLINLIFASETFASNCPPSPLPKPLLEYPAENKLVADVTVVSHLPPKFNQAAGSIEVQISRIYAGELSVDKIILDSTFYDGLGGCGGQLHLIPVGTRLMIGVDGPNEYGSFGGWGGESLATISDGMIEGYLLPPQCDDPSADDCRPISETMTLEDFITIAETLSPGTESEDYIFELFPAQPTESELVWLKVTKKDSAGCNLFENAISVDATSGEIKVSLHANDLTFTGCPNPDVYRFLIGDLQDPNSSRGYNVQVFLESTLPSEPRYAPDNLVAEFPVPIRSNPPFEVSPETPRTGSVQSGVGVIRGWACDAERVEVQFDDLPRMVVGYGTRRSDTRRICGDSNNGYGAVFAWGLLGHGPHTMTTYVDDRKVSSVEFEVAGLDSPFVTELDGTFVLEDFPAPGESVVVRWSEADQNFIIVEARP